eukprot:84295_1
MGKCVSHHVETADTQNNNTLENTNSDETIENMKIGRTLTKSICHRIVETTNVNKTTIKIFDKCKRNAKQSYMQELNILQTISGSSYFLTSFEDEYCYYINMKYLSGGQLFDRLLCDYNSITEKTKAHWVFLMLKNVKYCHDKHVIHGNLKAEHFLFENSNINSDLYLIDFSTAHIITDDQI